MPALAPIALAVAALATGLLSGCASSTSSLPGTAAATARSTPAASAGRGEDDASRYAQNSWQREALEGYRRVERDGQELWCRPDQVLGTRLSRGEVCYTAQQLENRRRASDEFMRSVQGGAANPAASAPSSAARQ